MNRTILWRVVKWIMLAATLWGVFSLGADIGSTRMHIQYASDRPNLPGCQLQTVARYPSADLATILKRDCDMGEHINYFLRLDISSRRPGPWGWWTIMEPDNDHYPVGDPEVVWSKKHTVQVTVSTRTLAGTLVVSDGDDTEIVRVYQPREPGAFPNYQ